jgi:NADH dehydrogenase FAD-containing subunit
MIDARVTVIDAKMVKLDKKNNRILIDKNAYIPFDLLIVTVGLIDTEL